MAYREEAARRYREARRAVARRVRPGHDAAFWTGYGDMATGLVDLLDANEVDLAGGRLMSLWCGDGAVALGLLHALRPSQLIAFDRVAADRDALLARAAALGLAPEPHPELHFDKLVPEGIPTPAATFDGALVAAAWSDFADLAPLLVELSRVVRGGGVVALTLSRDWSPRREPRDGEMTSFAPSLEEVQGAVLAGGLDLEGVTLHAPLTRIRQDQACVPLTSLAVRGVALLARVPAAATG